MYKEYGNRRPANPGQAITCLVADALVLDGGANWEATFGMSASL
jgi:hypothetical protein